MRNKSPKYVITYEYVPLHLPCQDTIRRLPRPMPCSFGFNDEALVSIRKTLAGLPLYLRRGSLLWDEMSITKCLEYDAQKMRFELFIDYGSSDMLDSHSEINDNEVAYHCLVFIFRPCRSSWLQPIAVFTTKEAIPGSIISRLLTKAIVALETAGARVKSVTCDGAQSNNAARADCRITGSRDENGNFCCSMEHQTAKETILPAKRILVSARCPSSLKMHS